MEPLSANDPRTVGEFTLRARLGAGGMGQVYLGFSPAGRAVAIKVVHSALLSDREFRERFGREVAAARAVSGMYTAPVVAAGLDDNPPWFATAFVPGPSLAGVVEQQGPLPEAAVWRLAAGLTEALRAVHACGLVHRDLKPANVLLAADGPHVIDFGISRAFEGTSLTQTGMVVGTPGYMSPEQAEGHQAGPPSDVFSLGCVLAFAATGSPAFGAGSAASVLYRVVRGEPDLAAVPARLRPIIDACLVKDPAERVRLDSLTVMISASGPATVATLGAFWPEPLNSVVTASQSYPTPTQLGPAADAAAPVAAPSGRVPAAAAAAGAAAQVGAAPAAMNYLPTATALSSTPAPAGAPGTALPGAVPPGAVTPGAVTPGAAGHAGMVPDGYLQAATRSMAAGSPLAPAYPGQPATPQAYQPPAAQPTTPWGQQPAPPAAGYNTPGGQYGTSYPPQPMPGSYPPQAAQYGGADPLAQYTPGLRRPTTAEVPGPVLAATRLMWTGLAFSALELVFAVVALSEYSHGEKTHPFNTPLLKRLHDWSGIVSAFGLVPSVIALALWTWLAVAARNGRSWTRVAGSVLFGISTVCTLTVLFRSWGDPAAKTFAVIVWGIGLTAIILLWGGQASAFFTAWRKHPPRRG